MGPRQQGESETEALVAVSCEIWSQTKDEILLITFKHPELLLGSRLHFCIACSDSVYVCLLGLSNIQVIQKHGQVQEPKLSSK